MGSVVRERLSRIMATNHETHETHEKRHQEGKNSLKNDSFGFNLGVVAEIHQEAESVACAVKVVVNLRTMFRSKLRDGLDLNDDFLPTHEIWDIDLLQGSPLVLQD